MTHRQKALVISSISLLVLLAGLIWYSTIINGENTKEVVIEKYLHAIEAGDEGAIISLVPKTHVAKEEAHQTVEMWGKGLLQNKSIEYKSDYGVAMSTAVIRGTYVTDKDEYEFYERVFLQQINGRWFLILGRHRDGLDSTTFPPSKP